MVAIVVLVVIIKYKDIHNGCILVCREKVRISHDG